jgi:hypothetical protein
MKHLIIGYGEIGCALHGLLNGDVEFIDKGYPNNVKSKDFDVIHICFGYTDNFIENVNEYLKKYNHDYIMVHSTVKVGTISKLNGKCIYSPVRGRHTGDGFMGDIKKYIKYYATNRNGSTSKMIKTWFKDVDLIPVDSIESLEFAKSVSTTYTLLNVLFEKWVYKKCKDIGLDYNFIYKEWNKSYNKNIKPEWKRPIYDRIEGNIGGHCLLPNLELIENDEFINIIKFLNKKYGSE